MALSKEQIEEEKKYLKQVLEIIKDKITTGGEEIEKKKADIFEMKKFMWDNLTDYTDEEIMVEMFNRDHEVNMTNDKIKSILKLEKSLDSPYFGKLIFKNEEFNETYPIYVGINTVEKDMDFFVFDWRAPISSMFYNYELGKAEYDAPDGKIKGEILNKRQFKIEKGKLIRCFDSSINIEDEFLQEILSKESTDKMQNIVSTIQKEQNEIIRNLKDKFLIVQGSAGSGKTSVALHRIAYLLYKYKELNSNNILIFSPNDVFSEYISAVLPELGEENVMKTTFYDFSKEILKCKNVESFTNYIERAYNTADNTIIKRKMSDNFKVELDEFLNQYLSNLEFLEGFSTETEKVTKEDINYLLKEKYTNHTLETRLEFIADYICNKCKLNHRKNKNKVQSKLIEKLNMKIDIFSVYNMLMEKLGYEKISQSNLKYEDITPLLYIYFKLNGFPNYSHVKQIVIDEAQDYSHLQMELISKLFSNASFTILGDINQTINPNYKYNSLKELSNLREKSNYLELNKTYRSSQEIIDYSNKVLGLNNVSAIRHSNNIPIIEERVGREDIDKVFPRYLDMLKSNGFKKNAIITKNKEEAIYLFKKLKNIAENLTLINENKANNINGNIIIPSYISKGLEFDGVIVYTDLETPYNENEKNLYYVVLTRAQHELIVFNQNLQTFVRTK